MASTSKTTELVVQPCAPNVNADLAHLIRPIDWFKPDPKNARLHPEPNIAALMHSLKKYQQNKNVVAVKDGTVIAGNGTLEAAKRLGWTGLAAVTFASEEEARAFALADNKTGDMSEWNNPVLLEQLEEIKIADVEAIGFTAGDVIDLSEFGQGQFVSTTVFVADLKQHPRNYRVHPADQIEHIITSIKDHGFYRNIVIAKDNTILAGHGVVQAVKKMGKKRVPVIRLDIDAEDPRAVRVLTSDNEISNLAMVDDRALTELLREIMITDDGLQGTGFDEKQLAALTYVTRPESEIQDKNAAAEWLGMPEFTQTPAPIKVVVSFRNEEDRLGFFKLINAKLPETMRHTVSIWHPEAERRDTASVRFKEG